MIEGSSREVAAEWVWPVAQVWPAIEGVWQSAVEDLRVVRATGCLVQRYLRKGGVVVVRVRSAGELDSSAAATSCAEASSATRLGASVEEELCSGPWSIYSACGSGSQRGPCTGGGGPPSSCFEVSDDASQGAAGRVGVQ